MGGYLIVKVLKQGESHGVELFQGSYEEAVEKAKACLSDDVVKALLFEEIAEIESAPVVRSIKAAAREVSPEKNEGEKLQRTSPPKPAAETPKSVFIPTLIKDSFSPNAASLVQCSCGSQFYYSPAKPNCPTCSTIFPMEEAKQRRYA